MTILLGALLLKKPSRMRVALQDLKNEVVWGDPQRGQDERGIPHQRKDKDSSLLMGKEAFASFGAFWSLYISDCNRKPDVDLIRGQLRTTHPSRSYVKPWRAQINLGVVGQEGAVATWSASC